MVKKEKAQFDKGTKLSKDDRISQINNFELQITNGKCKGCWGYYLLMISSAWLEVSISRMILSIYPFALMMNVVRLGNHRRREVP